MRKAKEASVLYIVVPICFTIICLSVWYGYPFNKITDQDLKVYQLALTAFAATVGIGTVVNSSRSTDTALKSMKLSEKKEVREQSAHLIISSSLTEFGMSPPMYENEFEYSPSGTYSRYFKEIGENYEVDEREYVVVEESAKKTAHTLRSKRLKKDNTINKIMIFNIGKGAGVSLEVSFDFLNKESFSDYEVSLSKDISIPSGTTFFPSYDMKIEKNDKIFLVTIVDNAIKHYMKLFQTGDYSAKYFEEATFVFENNKKTKYIDFINSHDKTDFALPNDFMILCKHYTLVYYYKKLEETNKLSSFVKPNIQHLVSSTLIKPIGRLTVKYFDEEAVRTNHYGDFHKKETTFDLVIKDESISVEDGKLNFYLEIVPSLPLKSKS